MSVQGKWRVLSEAQIAQIREAAVAHVERHGFVVQDGELLAKAQARGARVDEAQGRVEQLVAGYQSRVPEDIQDNLWRHFHDRYRRLAS